jgi:hypothetical protein
MTDKVINGGKGYRCFGNIPKPSDILILTKQPIKSIVTGEEFPADILLRVDEPSGEEICSRGLAKRMTIRDLVNLSKTDRRNGLLAALKGVGAIYETKN